MPLRWHFIGSGADALEPEIARMLRDLEAGRLQNRKSGRRKELYFVELGANGPHLLKVNRYPGASGWWRRLRGSKARREQRIARCAAARGLPVPLPAAWGERARGRLEACYLLVPRLPGVQDLSMLERDPSLPPATRRALAHAFGALSRRVHDAGLQQEDFAPNNFLVELGETPELYVVDFERARLRRGPVSRSARVRALTRLDRRLPGVSNRERWHFLLAYAAGREPARRWWRDLAARAAVEAANDLARLRRSSTREGRRIRRVRTADGSGWARREATLGALLAADGCPEAWQRRYAGQSGRRARELWALAHLLWLRGLGPRPLALLRREDRTALWLERGEDTRPLAEAHDREEALRLTERLLGRLLALGALDSRLEAGDVALIGSHAEGVRAVLLAPERLRVGEALAPSERLREARRRSGGLLGINP